MKIVSREDFTRLPAGTIYAKTKPCYFEELSVKGDTLGRDWLCRGLCDYEAAGEFIDAWSAMRDRGESRPLSESQGRDGCFDDEDSFLIYEAADLDMLADIVAQAKTVTK
jgi:hypothetical protein